MCPICVLLPSQDYQTRFVSLADHLIRDHDTTEVHSQNRTLDNKRELIDPDDDDDDDEDEAVPLNFLAERLFLKEETRRHDFTNGHHSNHRPSYRRVLSRHTNMRSSRGSSRGHFNHSPYTIISRTSSNIMPMPFQQSTESNSMNEHLTEQIFPQTSIFGNDFESSFATMFPGDAHFLATTISNFIPSLRATPFQQQNETNDRTNQKKTAITNGKQKRACLHPNQTSFQTFPVPTNSNPEQSTSSSTSTSNPIRTDEQRLENDSRSLLGRFIKSSEPNTVESSFSDQLNHLSFFKSLLFSTIYVNVNKTNEEQHQQLC